MTLFLTHVPKTAGTSMREAVFEHRVSTSDVHSFSGIRTALRSNADFDLLTGHYPYGTHALYDVAEPRYFVMLREPVDRAISQYYFTKMGDKPWYSHPDLADVKEHDLVSFYRKPAHQNLQTRYVAGLVWEWIGRLISLNGLFKEPVLRRARRHLQEKYESYGLKERFEESAHIFAKQLGTTPKFPEKRRKKTRDRPGKTDLDDGVLRELRKLNSLDLALYEFAKDHFRAQTQKCHT